MKTTPRRSKDTLNEAAVADWLDKQAITEVLYRYCRCIDRFDPVGLRTVYWPDAEDHHGAVEGTASRFCDFYETFAGEGSGLLASHHMLTNIYAAVTGTTAQVESYYQSYHRIVEDGVEQDEFVGGRYVDRFEKRQGEWRIRKRLTVYDWSRKDRATAQLWDRLPGNYLFGKRSREDPVYAPIPVAG